MATTSLHMTTMCLLYKPTVVACVCIHLACKWSSYRIEPCSEGREWFFYVDRSVTWEVLEKLTQDYISILERSPHRFKKKFSEDAASGYHGPSSSAIDEPLQNKPSTSSEKNSTAQKSRTVTDNDLTSKKTPEDPLKLNTSSQDAAAGYHGPSSFASDEPLPNKPSTISEKNSTAQKVHTITDNDVASKKTPEDAASSHGPSSVAIDEPLQNKPSTSSEKNSAQKVHAVIENDVTSRKTPEVPSSKHERREKHKSKHSTHSSKDRPLVSNHSEQSTGIKVKIRKDIISLSGITSQSSQKYPIPGRPESPKKTLKIKLPKPPMPETPKVAKPDNPTSIKLVITKDKSGSGSYSTSHKNERESRKRPHSSPIAADGTYKNSHEVSKYPKLEHSQRSHHADVTSSIKQNKVSRHSSHRSATDHTSSNSTSTRLQAVNESTFHNYNAVSNYQNFPFQLTPPPPPPKLRGHGMLVGKTNSNPPLPPPLPPPPPPPPE